MFPPMLSIDACKIVSQILTAPASIKISVRVCADAGTSSMGRAGLPPHSVLKIDYMVRTSIIKSGWF